MSDMNGNPHVQDAERLISADNMWQGVGYETADAQHIVGHLEANTRATLALAYEQRTANLIALAAMGVVDMTDWPANSTSEWIGRMVSIGTRLGVTEGEAK